MTRYIILGAGGSGRTIAGIMSKEENIFFLDDNINNKEVNGFKVLGSTDDILNFKDSKFIISFGTNYLNERINMYKKIKENNLELFNAIHENVAIDKTAKIGEGNMIAANCVINPNAEIKNNNTICVAVTIDHDSKIGNNNYISPGVNITGGVIIEDNILIGANACILPQIKISSNSIIGAGAVVTKDVPPNVTVVGIPAKIIKEP